MKTKTQIPLSELKPDAHFSWGSRVFRRLNIAVMDLDDKKMSSIDADAMVTPRPDLDANVATRPE